MLSLVLILLVGVVTVEPWNEDAVAVNVPPEPAHHVPSETGERESQIKLNNTSEEANEELWESISILSSMHARATGAGTVRDILRNILNTSSTTASPKVFTDTEIQDSATDTLQETNESTTISSYGSSMKVTESAAEQKPVSTPVRIPGTISKQKCTEYIEDAVQIYMKKGRDTKIDSKYYIIGGGPADPEEFPHMVALGYQDDANGIISWDCGGSLISENFVLTAAHCIKRRPPKYVKAGIQLSSQDGEKIKIKKLIPYPKYKSSSKYHDIGLVRLKSNVKFNYDLYPACLNTEKNISHKRASATGWGDVDFGGPSSNQLLKVEIDFYAAEVCNETYNEIINKEKSQMPHGILDDSMICAGSINRAIGICRGDSGGPLQVYHTIDPDVDKHLKVKNEYDTKNDRGTSFAIAKKITFNDDSSAPKITTWYDDEKDSSLKIDLSRKTKSDLHDDDPVPPRNLDNNEDSSSSLGTKNLEFLPSPNVGDDIFLLESHKITFNDDSSAPKITTWYDDEKDSSLKIDLSRKTKSDLHNDDPVPPRNLDNNEDSSSSLGTKNLEFLPSPNVGDDILEKHHLESRYEKYLKYIMDSWVSQPETYDIIGVSSFGRPCGAEKRPGVYTRVSNYVQWIEDIVWPAK